MILLVPNKGVPGEPPLSAEDYKQCMTIRAQPKARPLVRTVTLEKDAQDSITSEAAIRSKAGRDGRKIHPEKSLTFPTVYCQL
jgi:hypothetical protein